MDLDPGLLERNIRMDRLNLDSLPPVVIPSGYELRTADWPGFAEAWVALINDSFTDGRPGRHPIWTLEAFRSQHVSQPQFDPAGLFFVFCAQEPVATAFAWLDSPDERDWGRVHWVATLPGHRKRGLAGAVTVAVMRYFADRGFRNAFLQTQGSRLPAIRLYLSLGFVPAPRDNEERAIWDYVMGQLLL